MVQVPAMSSRQRVREVTRALRDVSGVTLVQADLATTTVLLHGNATPADVLAALDAAGFRSYKVSTAEQQAARTSSGRAPTRARREDR
jgi:copper chaperone CopZ